MAGTGVLSDKEREAAGRALGLDRAIISEQDARNRIRSISQFILDDMNNMRRNLQLPPIEKDFGLIGSQRQEGTLRPEQPEQIDAIISNPELSLEQKISQLEQLALDPQTPLEIQLSANNELIKLLEAQVSPQ